MVAKIKTDVIEKADGSPVDLSGQSAAKVHANFNGSALTFRSSFNISSATDYATGSHAFNLTSVMSDANYPTIGSCARDLPADSASVQADMAGSTYQEAGRMRFQTKGDAGSAFDSQHSHWIAIGDLA